MTFGRQHITREYPELSATNNKTLRTDLAILKDGIVKERAELKACYTFDIPKKNKDYNLFWNQALTDYEKHKFKDSGFYEMGEAFGIRVGIVYYLWEKID